MKPISALMVAAALVAGGAACAGSPDVKFGAIVSLQGVGAAYGNSIKNGIELAVEEINAAGGIHFKDSDVTKQITLMLRDTESDPIVATQHARELIDAGAHAVIGSDVSDVTLAIAPIFEEAEIVLLSPSSSSPKLTRAGDFIFRNFPSDELEALNTADYIYNKRGLRQAAIIANQNEFGIGIKNAFIERFRQLGGRVVGQTTYPPDATEFGSQVAEIMLLEVPAIYIAGYTRDTAAVVKALRDAGEDAELFATGAMLTEELDADGKVAVEGLYYPLPSFDPDSEAPHVRAFVEAYRSKYGFEPDTYAGHGYDAVMMLAQAVQEAGLDHQEIRFYLNSMNPYDGVTGLTDFDDNGDVRKFHRMHVVRGGVGVPVDRAGAVPESAQQR